VVTAHQPTAISVGLEFVAAELAAEALARCLPDPAAFRAALQPGMAGRLSLFVYTRAGSMIRARMFAPLAGTVEDAATGSASSALGAFLL
jgi:trans-2,3-dihydro-3-hydroxyanthranilate isomerase